MKTRLATAVVVSVPVVAAALVAGYAAGHWAGAGADRARRDAELAEARRLAYTDGLTGLANRAALNAELARRQHRGARFAVLMVDLDRFKPVNDMYGHDAGDAVLVEVARRLTALTHHGGFVARPGGDEFVLIAAAHRARELGHEVHEAIAAPVTLAGGQTVSVGASVGIAYAAPGLALCKVLHRADLAMYRAKAGTPSVIVDADTATAAGCAVGRSSVRQREARQVFALAGAGREVTR